MKFNRLSASAVACFAVVCALVGSTEVNASPYVVTIEQVGADVVATGSGTIDLTGLTFSFANNNTIGLNPAVGYILTGASGVDDAYIGNVVGPALFGSGDFPLADSSSGDLVGVNGFNGYIFVPHVYVSGTALSDNATYDDATFASLGVTPGTYVWTWGSAADQSFTLEIGTTPLPAALPLFATSLGALGLLGWRRKRKAVALAA